MPWMDIPWKGSSLKINFGYPYISYTVRIISWCLFFIQSYKKEYDALSFILDDYFMKSDALKHYNEQIYNDIDKNIKSLNISSKYLGISVFIHF